MPLTPFNQWHALRENTKGAPADVRLEAVSRADQPAWSESLRNIPWEVLDSNAALRDRAEALARSCQVAGNLPGMERIAEGTGIKPPSDKHSRIGRVARLTCPMWWRRQLRRAWGEAAENALRKVGHVHRDCGSYISDWTFRRRRAQRRIMLAALQEARLISEAGDDISLFEAWEHSTANPSIRRTELMARLGGFERLAAELGHVPRFYTLTAPSAFHSCTTVNNATRMNPRYSGATAAEAQAWLNKMWRRIRSKLKRDGILVYGFRIVEPHHDGTPHWHLLLWMPPHQRVRVRRILRSHLWSEYSDEPGMRRHRCHTRIIHPDQGSAVGYTAKYIAKNIDGFGIDDDHEAHTDAVDGSQRAESWATCYRFRQFQQIGGPPVQLYREFRRLRTPLAPSPFENVRAAADAGDWAAFIKALGGIEICWRSPFTLKRGLTGELSRYGDLKPPQIEGLTDGETPVCTRTTAWRVKWGSCSSDSPWTRVNNCTVGHKRGVN